jgi:hypothetical protein
MAYPIADGIAGCQAPHNVSRFPKIFLEYWLNINKFDGIYTAQDELFVLSMCDPNGYGFHPESYVPLPLPLPTLLLQKASALSSGTQINGSQVGALNRLMKTCRPGNTGVPSREVPPYSALFEFEF